MPTAPDAARVRRLPVRLRSAVDSVVRLAERVSSASWVARYGLGAALALLTIGGRLALTPIWGSDVRLIMFVPAVLLAAWFGGAAPALLATAICAAGAAYFWMTPVHSLLIGDPEDALALGAFLFVGGLCGVIIEALHAARRRLERDS